MSFNIVSAKITGNPDRAGWAQSYEFTPLEVEKAASRGHLFAVISTPTGEEGVESVFAGREVLGRLHEEYFGLLEEGAFSALKHSDDKVMTEFSSWEDVEIVCISQLTDVSYMVGAGGAQIMLYRDAVLTPLIKNQKGKVISVSGKAKEGDIFIIGTNSFFQLFSLGIIRGALQGRNLTSIAEVFGPSLHAREGVGNVGALFLKFENKVPPQSESEIDSDSNSSRLISADSQGEFLKNDTAGEITKESFSTKLRQKPFGFLHRLRDIKVYVREGNRFEETSSPKRKLTLGIGVLLLLLLTTSIFFGIKKKHDKDMRVRYEEIFTETSHQLTEAQDLFQLNPERSRELLLAARDKVLGLTSEGFGDPELTDLKKKIEDNEKKILGEYSVTPQLFVELSLLSDNFNGDEMVASEGTLYVTDRDSRKIVSVVLATKRSEVVIGPQTIERIESVAAYGDRIFVLNSEGVSEVGDSGANKVIDKEWLSQALPFAYASNLYILDEGASMIYRHAGTDNGFGTKKDWIAPGVTIDLTQTSSWVIDGSIWVLDESGKILKLSYGNPQNFSISGVFPPMSLPKAIYTGDEEEFLYILDSENERVVVVDKDGKFKAQYISSDISQAKGLVVSEEERKIILLTGERLLSIEMEHF